MLAVRHRQQHGGIRMQVVQQQQQQQPPGSSSGGVGGEPGAASADDPGQAPGQALLDPDVAAVDMAPMDGVDMTARVYRPNGGGGS